jgi:signal transduction histidine kinase
MEINKPPKLASQFWPTFYKTTIILSILSQLIIIIGIALLLLLTGAVAVDSLAFWLIISVFLVISLVVNAVIILLTVQPTKDLLAVIIHVSGEQPSLKLPDINNEKYEKTGFHDALQTIYELAGAKDKPEQETAVASTQSASIVATALDQTTCGFVALDSNKKIVYANKAAPVHIDSNGNQILDLIFNEGDAIGKWLEECDEHSVHNEKVWTRIPDKLPNQENRRFFDVMASYQKDTNPETVIALVDRTSAYAVDEENLDFVSFAAHELRGPITVILGYLDVLNDELANVLENDQKELFRRLIISSNRLSGYINNILNTSRYDRRHLKVYLVEQTVGQVYDIIKDDMQLRASAQNRLLSVKIPSNLPTIAVDKASMSEVFGNLIDNAIKYSNEGGVINFTAKVNGDFVDVSVEDHGIGMPESVVSQLFQKFYRSHRSRESVAGTGIGLYISKAIVESHGGNISVRSEDGRGSTFTVSIPIYATVADKIKAGDNSNVGIISEGRGWIKNHAMYRS